MNRISTATRWPLDLHERLDRAETDISDGTRPVVRRDSLAGVPYQVRCAGRVDAEA